MFRVLHKSREAATQVELIVSVIEIPGAGCLVRTQTVLREGFSESSEFVPGVKVVDGKFVADDSLTVISSSATPIQCDLSGVQSSLTALSDQLTALTASMAAQAEKIAEMEKAVAQAAPPTP